MTEYTWQQLITRAWTPYAIRRFLKPTRTESCNKQGDQRLYFSNQRVVAAESRKDVVAYNAKRATRESDAARLLKHHAKYAAKYGSWQKALPAACDYLFELNRHTKSFGYRLARMMDKPDDIYDLKNQMVELVYKGGYSTDCYLHNKTELPAKSCWSCGESGQRTDSFFGSTEQCQRCYGTGIYLGPKTLTFVCFRFLVGEKNYCWHQPDNLTLVQNSSDSERLYHLVMS
jgi:hypothetical protein